MNGQARRSAPRPPNGEPGSREAVLASLLRTRAEAQKAGLSDLEKQLREQILRALPVRRPAPDGDPVCQQAEPDGFHAPPPEADGTASESAADPPLSEEKRLHSDEAGLAAESLEAVMPDLGPPLAESAAIKIAQLAKLPALEGRRSERRVVNLAADLREPGASIAEVEVLNISEEGFMISTDAEAEIGSVAWLKLPGLEPLKSQVVWAEDGRLGCRFLTPLYPATLELILKPAAKRKRRLLFTPPPPPEPVAA